MNKSIDTEIADGIVAMLEEAKSTFSADFEAERLLLPRRDSKELLHKTVVDVIPVGIRSELLNRKRFQETYIVHWAITSGRIGELNSPDEVDGLGYLRQEIQKFIQQPENRYISLTEGRATLTFSQPFVNYSIDHLFSKKLYLCPVETHWIVP